MQMHLKSAIALELYHTTLTSNLLELFNFRAPPLPITCYHGNCYVDCLEVLREHNVTKGLKFILFTEGGSYIFLQ